MRVGHGVAHVAVQAGEPMGGYADRNGGIEGQLDPLEVHALVLLDGGSRFALLIVDLVCVNTDVVQAIRADLTAAHHVDTCWVAATHTHAGPEAGCRPGGASTPPPVTGRLLTAARSAVGAALAVAVPARLDPLRRPATAGLADRRSVVDPRPADIPLDIAAVRSAGGDLLGLLVVSPVHPTVLPADNRRASADLTGAIRQALRRRLRQGPAAPWVMVATGAAGDISTRHTRRGRDATELERLGELVAAAVGEAVERAAPEPGTDGRGLWARQAAQLRLPARRPDDLPSLATLRKPPGTSRRSFDQGRELAAALLNDPERPDSYEVPLEAVRLGGLDVVAVPGELFLCLGERIRSSAPRPCRTLVLGYTNGYLGYLPCQEAFSTPQYEVLVSPVRPGSGEVVVEAAIALLSELDGEEEQA